MDSVLQNVLDIIIMPLQRVVVLLWNLNVGDVSIGALILIGTLFAVLIEILVHSHGSNIGSFKKGGKDD